MQPANSKTQDSSATKTTSSNLTPQVQQQVSPDLSLALITLANTNYRDQRSTRHKFCRSELSTNLPDWAIPRLRSGSGSGSGFWKRRSGFKCAQSNRSDFRIERQLVSGSAQILVRLCSHLESESERTPVGPNRQAKVRRQTVLQDSVGWQRNWLNGSSRADQPVHRCALVRRHRRRTRCYHEGRWYEKVHLLYQASGRPYRLGNPVNDEKRVEWNV